MHVACDDSPECDVCGLPFLNYHPREADPLWNATCPPHMRSNKMIGPILAAFLAALAVLLAYYLMTIS